MWLRSWTFAICISASTFALCAGSIKLTAYPAISIADGYSTVTITADVRTSSGQVPSDGTLVRFTTSAGTFRQQDVQTTSGTARAVLVAPTIPGVAKVTASATGVGIVNSIDIEFVKDRATLASLNQYIEIDSPEYLAYFPEIDTLSASGQQELPKIRFKDITIEAKDLQVNVATMVVIATEAKLRVGEKTIECKRLRYVLNRRRGSAIAAIDGRAGYYVLTAAEGTLSDNGMPPNEYEFADIGVASSSVHANRAVIFPHREVQFHQAELYVGDTKVMGMPLYAIRPHSDSGIIGDQIVSFQNDALVLNYPYYVRLSPSFKSVLRLRSGQDYGRGATASSGFFMEWENSYMKGDTMEGSLTLTSIGRDDMGINWRHTQRFDDRTSANASIDFPGFRTLYGALTLNRAFDGFNMALSGTSSRSLRGTPYETQRLDFNVTTNMQRLGDLPLSYTVGLTANSSRVVYGPTTSEQEGAGLRTQFVLTPQPLWTGANLTASATLSRLWGKNAGEDIGVIGTLGIATPLGPNSSLRLSYDYTDDNFMSSFMGKHRVSGTYYLDAGNISLSLFGGTSLDIDSTTAFVDGYWRISSLWRVGSSFTLDEYLGTQYRDTTLFLGYRLGTREIGVTYSLDRQKFGFQLLNVAIR